MIDLSRNKNVLIIRLGKIGDIIMASAVFEIMKRRFPEISISLLTLKRNRDVLKHNPYVDHKYFVSKNLSLYILLLRIRKHRYNMLIDLNDDSSVTSRILRRKIKADITVGFDFEEKDKPDISIKRPSKHNTHILERIVVILKGINIIPEKDEMHPVLYIGKSEEAEIKDQLEIYKNNYKILAINISAGATIREWSEEKYKTLVMRLSTAENWKILILHLEKDSLKAKRIMETAPDKFIPMDFKSFQHYASYIRNVDLLISPDTSAVHIASSFNIPVIALYPAAEWNYVSWQPLSKIKRSLRSGEENINGITVDEVLKAFTEINEELSHKE